MRVPACACVCLVHYFCHTIGRVVRKHYNSVKFECKPYSLYDTDGCVVSCVILLCDSFCVPFFVVQFIFFCIYIILLTRQILLSVCVCV